MHSAVQDAVLDPWPDEGMDATGKACSEKRNKTSLGGRLGLGPVHSGLFDYVVEYHHIWENEAN